MTSPRLLLKRARASLSHLDAWLGGIPKWLVALTLWSAGRLAKEQLRTLYLPILGEHRWRESVTYSVAYNFVHESFDFLHPRIDFTSGRTGIMAMEAPVLPYLTAIFMRFFGDSPSIGRVIVWSLSAVGLFACLALVHRIRGAGLVLGFLFAFLLSPMTLVELRQLQPDGPAGMFLGVAAFFFFRFASLQRRRDYVLGIAAFTLAVFMKGPGIVLIPAFLAFTCAARRVSLGQVVARAAGFMVPIAVYLAWSLWAHHLSEVYNAGWSHFSVDFTLTEVKKNLEDVEFRKNIFWYVYPCYVTNWTLFPALIVGVAVSFQRGTKRVSGAFLLWLLLGSFFFASFADRLRHNWYYADLVLVPVIYFVGFGLSEVFRVFARGPLRTQPIVARWAALVILATLAVTRKVTWDIDRMADIVGGVGSRPDNSWMSDWHLTTLLFGLAFAMVAASLLSTRRLRLAAFVLLPFALYGIGRAQRDAINALAWRTRANEVHRYRKHWINTLRPMVDHYSTRADLFLVDEEDGDDPYWLHLPLRKGWAIDVADLNEANLAYCQRSGARFFLTYHDKKPPESMHLALLGSSPEFGFYCLDPNGCEPRR